MLSKLIVILLATLQITENSVKGNSTPIYLNIAVEIKTTGLFSQAEFKTKSAANIREVRKFIMYTQECLLTLAALTLLLIRILRLHFHVHWIP